MTFRVDPSSRAPSWAVALSAFLSTTTPVWAQDAGLDRPSPAQRTEARNRFAQGLDLFNEMDFAGALVEFRRAYTIAPDYHVLFNIGQVCFQLQDYPCALKALQQYLGEGGADLPLDRRHAVERDLERLRSRVAIVTIRSNVVGATLTVDEVRVGSTPWTEPLIVKVGSHRFTAVLSGRPEISRTVALAGEDRIVVDLDFPTLRAAVPVATAPTTSEAEAVRPARTVWPFWAGTAGLAIGAAVVGTLALRAADEMAHDRDTYGISRTDLDTARQRGQGLALASDLLMGAFVLCGGAAIYVTLRGSDHPEQRTRTTAASSSDVAITATPGSLYLRTVF